jgi:hypothetical protein
MSENPPQPATTAPQSQPGALAPDIGEDGLITIEVDDKDPKRSADMANAYVQELSKLSHGFVNLPACRAHG